MEFIIMGIISLITIAILKYVFDYNIKKIKHIGENKALDEISQKYPSNIELCKSYLKILNNEKVKIEENSESDTSLYIAITDKIIIGNIENTYTRIQTIAHECLHSIQSRKMLLFNFIFSNIYLLYFLIVAVLGLFQKMPNKMLFLSVFLVLSLIYYVVRVYLENDAMINAKYLAKKYMQDSKISTKEEIDSLVEGFDNINKVGVKTVNCHLAIGIMMKVFLLSTVFLLR